MKYDLSKIMKRAWVIKRKNKRNIFGLCLKMSWCEFKKVLKDKLVNDMLHIFCSQKRPKGYRKDMCTETMLRMLKRNNITVPPEIDKFLSAN